MLEHLNPTPHAPRRVVVMGAGGFVGGAICRRLKVAGIEILALGRGDIDLLAPGASERLATQLRPDDSFVAVSALAPVKNLSMLAQNVVMLNAMYEALAKRPPCHLLNIGSDAVFADGPLPLSEHSPKAPTSLHGIMHSAREVAFADLKVPVATLRPTLIYGTGDPHNGYGPNRFFRLAADHKDIVLFGEGEERRDHVFIEDVAELATRILLHRSQGSLNAATGDVWSFREVAHMAARLFDPPVAIKGTPRQGPMPHGGYRPFDSAATHRAFPDFRYTALGDGLAIMRRAASE
jgi:nucleoside-diphosphate-sugar epimerase